MFHQAKNNNMAREVCSGLKPSQHPRRPLKLTAQAWTHPDTNVPALLEEATSHK